MKKLQVIAGNCVLESLKTSVETSSFLKEMSEKFNFELIYKSSYKKDNRSSSDFFSTLGHDECADIFSELKKKSLKPLFLFENMLTNDFPTNEQLFSRVQEWPERAMDPFPSQENM